METENILLKSKIPPGSFGENIGTMILDRIDKFPGKIAIQEKKDENYYKTSWKEIINQVKQIGLGLIMLGFEKGDRIAILSRDCSEILAFELACMSIGCVYMPFFLGYYPKQIEYVISHADPKYVVVSDDFQLEKILSTMATGRIEKYFLLDYSEKYLESTRIFDFKLIYKDSEDYSLFYERVADVSPDDVCLLIYTSGGTTGISKGVELTHRNVLGQQSALNQVLKIDENDIILSYYPWHQSLGIVEKFAAIFSGACLTLDRTPGLNVDTIPDFLNVTKPTIYFGSAKVFNELIYEIKKNKKLEAAFFHDRVNFVFASSNPSKEVINYFLEKNIPLLQGWGLTETLQYVTVNSRDDKWQLNTSGFPIPGTEIKLEGEEREIWVRGINVMKGYYKDKERTALTITPEGWLKTGDAGLITENGLKILGRIDSIFYLRDGRKVYASEIEQMVENSSIYISHCVIFGENKPDIGALIFPYPTSLMKWYERNNGYSIPLIDALDEKEVIDLYREKLRLVNKMSLEDNPIRYFTLVENELTVKKGELTSGMTVVRKQVISNYKYLTEAFYLEEGFFPELKSRIIEV